MKDKKGYNIEEAVKFDGSEDYIGHVYRQDEFCELKTGDKIQIQVSPFMEHIPIPCPKVYLASKLHHAEMLRDIAAYLTTNRHYEITSSWLWQIETLEDSCPGQCKAGWVADVLEVQKSDYFVLYAERQDNPRGALVEAGVALGLGYPVILVGENVAFGTWQFHPLVHRTKKLEGAWNIIDQLEKNKSIY